jgi:hypothetical protein|nr:MAG TPA: Receptor Binding Protein [Caudoviricetes sp.]
MAMQGLPFDAKQVTTTDGTYWDREVFSKDLAKYFGHLTSNGILLGRGRTLTDELQVVNQGQNALVSTGYCMIEGRMGWLDKPEVITFDIGGNQPRIDTVAVELNTSSQERRFKVVVIKGVESSYPVPPQLTRNDTVYQLGLADIKRFANSSALGAITDTRQDANRCGVASVDIPNQKFSDIHLDNSELESKLVSVLGERVKL